MKVRILLLTALAFIATVRTARAQVPNFDHVFVIVMENHEYEDIIGNPEAPYINSLARQYGLATNNYAPLHPSLPNYMALTGGDTFFTTNCVNCQTPAANIADQIESSGRTWRAYMEDMPAPCTATDSGLYVAKHNPFVHYSNIVFNASRCTSHDVPFSRFSTDLASGALANFVWITPNLCSNMHDCSIGTGDSWLASLVPQILQSPSFGNSVLFLAWDEGITDIGGGGHIPLIVVSPRTPAGFVSSAPVNHYSVLRTIQDGWGLPPLAQSANATALSQFFPSPAEPPTEQVIYAKDVSTVFGAWHKEADATAADGVKLSTQDNGAPTVAAAQANPTSYFAANFTAQPGVRYRVWLRIHAAGDLGTNDSVFVQFSDSVDDSGNPVYRSGTSAAYVVNLWSCSTCPSFGWGWQRTAYGQSDSGDVWFPTGGVHTIRLQAREDGVEIDQIVISPAQYADAGPGPVSADNTIVSKPGSIPPPTTLPSPWQDLDVGATGVAGSASYSSGVFTVRGAGADIWGSADGFHYVAQPLSGDGQIVARVVSVQNTGSFAKAGIMLRATTTADAAHVILDVSPDGSIEFMTRSATGESTSFIAGGSQAVPAWLRLVRSDNTVTASSSANGTSWSTVGVTMLSIAAGATVGLVVTSHDTSTLNTSTFDNVTVNAGGGGGGGSLPSPWTNQDVGSTGIAGTASYANGTFTVKGAGGDIWGTADAFQYVSQPLNGDGQIVVRVVSTQDTNTYAKAGVMLRQTTAGGSAHVLLDVRPDGSLEFMTRSTTGASTTFVAGGTQGFPTWLKLARSGGTVTGYASGNGTTWTTIGSTATSMPMSASIGLAVTSHDTSTLNTASFDNVAVGAGGGGGGTLPSPWTHQDVGSIGAAGNASFTNGTFTVTGAGADIWGTADAFHYVSQPMNGDAQIVARVTGVQNTNTYAKAGVMLRQSTAAGSAHVILDVRPDGSLEFMRRSAAGGSTMYLGGGAQALPVWLMLTRSGGTIAGYVSADGSTWTLVGSTTTSMPSSALIGLVVTSHDTSATNTSTFDNVAVGGP